MGKLEKKSSKDHGSKRSGPAPKTARVTDAPAAAVIAPEPVKQPQLVDKRAEKKAKKK